ncbi:type VI secretion system baseplate subunit TssG [Pseudenhygromyxa sp. WMMC2535]|uniref:type VI secretion system baseplate subunit TssG n=1 Tax=Pseudenhygromyxa sp. WMMC2535 TaxID=2712867 RepID=UPI001552A797|nr:type VI secretion system baseplate subunit TssG [Pseudenhygromyxa sp. WMMC2535]
MSESPDWLTRLLAEPSAFDPFVVVGLLEQLTVGAPQVGGDGPYDEEAIHFRHSRSLAFKPGDMHAAEVHEDGRKIDGGKAERFDLTLNIVGLTGTSSPLPTYLASEAASDDDAGNTKADFFDLFHHRLHSLLYRSLRKHEWAQEHTTDGDEVWARRVLAALGVDTYDRPPLKYIRPLDLLRIAPLMASSARTARTVELAIMEILGHQLHGAEVSVKQFQGGWANIDQDHKIKLAVENSNLAISAIIGDMCLHRAGKAQVVVGPLDKEGLKRFLAGGDAFLAIRELLDLLSYELVEFELELILAKSARTGTILGVSIIGDDAWLEFDDDEGSGKGEETTMIVPLSQALDMVEKGEL